MIDHLTLTVRDYERSKAFYQAALAPLGMALQMEFGQMCGIGPKGMPGLWLKPGDAVQPMHLALSAADRPAVDAFYQAALAAGAKDNGAPGIRQDYHPNYYAAFVLDLDGHNLEAVCHRSPEELAARAKPAAKASARTGAAR